MHTIQANGADLHVALSGPEQADLIAFLDTLTDEEFIHDARLAEQP